MTGLHLWIVHARYNQCRYGKLVARWNISPPTDPCSWAWPLCISHSFPWVSMGGYEVQSDDWGTQWL